MDSIVYKIDLDCRRSESQAKIEAKSGEASGRKIIFSLYEGRSPFVVPNGVIAVFRAKKPSGAVLFNNCTITDDGNIEYVITTQTVAEVGIMPCELQLIQGGKVIFSPCFTMVVVNNLAIDSEVESSDEFTELVEALEEVKTLGEAVHTVNGKTPDDDGDVTLDTDDIYLSPESEHYAATDTVTEVLDGITTELIKKADTEYVDDAIGSIELKDGEVTTAKIKDKAVTNAKLAQSIQDILSKAETDKSIVVSSLEPQRDKNVIWFSTIDRRIKYYDVQSSAWVEANPGYDDTELKEDLDALDTRVTYLEEHGTGGGIPDAPIDGKQYARKDGAWSEVQSGTSYDDTAIKARVSAIEAKESTWDAKSNFSGNYNDLTNKPTIPEAVTDAHINSLIDAKIGNITTLINNI